MSAVRLARPIRLILSRLGAILLVLALLLPGQPLQAAQLPAAARPAHNRPALLPVGPVDPANVAPVAHNDSVAAFTNEDFQELFVLDNDTDVDGDTLIVTDVAPAAHGDAAGGPSAGAYYSIFYKPNPGFSGDDTFGYTISDQHSHASTATVTVHVAASGLANNRFAVYSGSNDSTRWTISPYGGTIGGNGPGATCDGSAGLSVEDALLENPLRHYNAFDNGLTIWVNNNEVPPTRPMFVTRHSLVSGPTVMANLRIYLKYYGVSSSNTLRTQVQFINLGGTSIPVTVTVATNLGTDAFTVIPGSSDGNTSFNVDDRWLVTSDSLIIPNEIVDTHVLFGPGASVTSTLALTSAFGCGDIQAKTPFTDTHGLRYRFQFSVPAFSTRDLLFFNQAHDSNTGALADAAAFDHEPVAMLAGLSNADLAETVNWNLVPVLRLFLPLLKR